MQTYNSLLAQVSYICDACRRWTNLSFCFVKVSLVLLAVLEEMASIFLAGVAVAGAAMAARLVLSAAKRVPLGAASAGGASKTSQKWIKGFEPTMTREEALKILGLREGATKEQIAEAHRRLMRINHPDNGGSTLIASKINEAKDLLLGRRTSYRGY